MFERLYLVASILTLCLGCNAPAQGQTQRANAPLKVVELFTSQGCSSCPPANANLTRLADRPDILALSFGVDYWDYLGWADSFANSTYTQRQRDYARQLRLRAVYTPQMVINGRVDLVGNNLGDIERQLGRVRPLDNGPKLELRGRSLLIGETNTPLSGASVFLVTYDPRIMHVSIARGENGGKTLPHINVVRGLVRLGAYNGRSIELPLPTQSNNGLRSAIILQASTGGPILAALKL
jgi:hypothetical protein